MRETPILVLIAVLAVADSIVNITAGCVTVIRSCNGDGNITVDENTDTSWCCGDESKYPLEEAEGCSPDIDVSSTCRLCYEFWHPQPLLSVAVIMAEGEDCPDKFTVSTYRLDGLRKTRKFTMPRGGPPGCANEIPFPAEDVRSVCVSPHFDSDILKPACVAEVRNNCTVVIPIVASVCAFRQGPIVIIRAICLRTIG